jgi:hypothetical protein
MKIIFKFDSLTYLYHNNPLFNFMYTYDQYTLPLMIVLTFVCFFNGWYIPMLISSILLLFFNIFFIFDILIFLPLHLYLISDLSFWLRMVSVVIGIWGLTRSFKEVKTMVLDNERVIDSYNFMVEGGGGREDWVLGETERFIRDSHMPGIITEQKDVSPEFLALEKRKFLIVRHAKYKEFRMFIGARSFGEHLDASWFLAVDPGFFKRTVSKHVTGNPHALSQRLDFFAQQDIKAFKTVSHECFKRVLEMLMEELKLDPTGLNANTKGFLNAW